MFQSLEPIHPGLRAFRLLTACCAALLVACGGDDTTPSESDGGNGGAAAGSGATSGTGMGGAGESGSSAGGSGAGGTGGSGAGGAGGSGAGGAGGNGGSGDSSLYGYFNIVMNPAIEETSTPANTTLLGKLYDGENPSPANLQKKDEVDDCQLLTPVAVLCQPACGSGAVCVSTNTCMPYATAQTAGTVKVKGLGASEISMEPRANNYQLPAGTMLEYPPCGAGAKIELTADGGGHGAFKIEALCIAPLETSPKVTLMKGSPLALRWTAQAATGTRIHVLLDISQHGTSKGRIECDTADDGMLDVPAKLVDALIDLGISGFPTVLLTRENEGKSGNVVLNVSAPYRSAVEIPGLTSCTEDSECPMGQKCLSDLKCG